MASNLVDDNPRLYSSQLKVGLAPSAVRSIHSVLHRALKQAVKWELGPRNAAAATDPPTLRTNKTRWG
jgi:hypothetical protein